MAISVNYHGGSFIHMAESTLTASASVSSFCTCCLFNFTSFFGIRCKAFFQHEESSIFTIFHNSSGFLNLSFSPSDESVLVAQGRSSAAKLKALSKVTQKQNRSWKSSLRIDEGSGQRGTLVSLLPSPLPEGLGLPPTMGLPNGSAVPPSVGLSDVSAPLAFPDASALDIGSKQVSDWSQSTTVQQKHAGKRVG